MPSAAFTTLGCKVNQYETQKILESFENAGFEIVPFDSAADVYVVNSCSVTSIAESKSRYTIRRANRKNPAGKVVVTGCAAQMAINRDDPIEGADLIVPNPEKLASLQYFLSEYPELRPDPDAARAEQTRGFQGRTRATLKVQDGCSVHCTYCSIPFTRPGMVSRPVDQVLEEGRQLSKLGYREVVLTGVLIGAYGPESGSGGPNFEKLVELISDECGFDRVRISSIEMHQVTDQLISLIEAGKVVPHLHIPLQSGDTQVLKDMNRRYTQDDFLRLCSELKRRVPDLNITTDIMVGFPTESEERFESTLHVCREVGFLKAHVFRFSPRFGTPADQWGDPVSGEEKTRRSLEVARISEETGRERYRRFLGRTLRVLVEGKLSRGGLLQGLTDQYLEVAFPGPATLQRSTCWVTAHEYADGQLIGELSPQPSSSQLALHHV